MTIKEFITETLNNFHSVISGIYQKKTDIINSLTSTDTTNPLSANQGKVLNDKLIEVNNRTLGIGSFIKSGDKPADNVLDYAHTYFGYASSDTTYFLVQCSDESGNSSLSAHKYVKWTSQSFFVIYDNGIQVQGCNNWGTIVLGTTGTGKTFTISPISGEMYQALKSMQKTENEIVANLGRFKYCGTVSLSGDGTTVTVSLDSVIPPSDEVAGENRGLYLLACLQGGNWKGSLHVLEVTHYYQTLTTLANTGSYAFTLGGSLTDGLTITTNSVATARFYKLW